MSVKSRIVVCLLSFALLAAGLALLTAIQNSQRSRTKSASAANGIQSMPVTLSDGRNVRVLLPDGLDIRQGMKLSVPVMLEDGTVTTGTLNVKEKKSSAQTAQGTVTPGQLAMRDPGIAAMVNKGRELGFKGKPIKTELEDGSVLVAWVDDPGNIKKGTVAPAVLPDLSAVTVELEPAGDPSGIVVLEP